MGRKTLLTIKTNQEIQLKSSVSKSISPYKEKKSYFMNISNPLLSVVALTNMTVMANTKEAIMNKNEEVVRVTAMSMCITFRK